MLQSGFTLKWWVCKITKRQDCCHRHFHTDATTHALPHINGYLWIQPQLGLWFGFIACRYLLERNHPRPPRIIPNFLDSKRRAWAQVSSICRYTTPVINTSDTILLESSLFSYMTQMYKPISLCLNRKCLRLIRYLSVAEFEKKLVATPIVSSLQDI